MDNTKLLKDAGVLVRKRRLAAFPSQAAAAAAGGTTSMSWRKVERGAPDVSEGTMAAVDRAFGWDDGTTAALRAGEITEAPPVLTANDLYRRLEAQLLSVSRDLEQLTARVAQLER